MGNISWGKVVRKIANIAAALVLVCIHAIVALITQIQVTWHGWEAHPLAIDEWFITIVLAAVCVISLGSVWGATVGWRAERMLKVLGLIVAIWGVGFIIFWTWNQFV